MNGFVPTFVLCVLSSAEAQDPLRSAVIAKWEERARVMSNMSATTRVRHQSETVGTPETCLRQVVAIEAGNTVFVDSVHEIEGGASGDVGFTQAISVLSRDRFVNYRPSARIRGSKPFDRDTPVPAPVGTAAWFRLLGWWPWSEHPLLYCGARVDILSCVRDSDYRVFENESCVVLANGAGDVIKLGKKQGLALVQRLVFDRSANELMQVAAGDFTTPDLLRDGSPTIALPGSGCIVTKTSQGVVTGVIEAYSFEVHPARVHEVTDRLARRVEEHVEGLLVVNPATSRHEQVTGGGFELLRSEVGRLRRAGVGRQEKGVGNVIAVLGAFVVGILAALTPAVLANVACRRRTRSGVMPAEARTR